MKWIYFCTPCNLEWSRIRLLTKWDDIEIDYNASGIRTRKGNTYYELDGDTIISETTNGKTIRYYYGNGGIVGFKYNDALYYYKKNLQGDIIAICDDSGGNVCEYTYDAWGNCTVENNDIYDERIGDINPFRYRGYYYDSDMGLYYLKSRYYDPQTGRFINADSVNYLGANGDLGAYNLFAYCSDKPTRYKDFSGHSIFGAIAAFAMMLLAGMGLSGCSNGSNGSNDSSVDDEDIANLLYGDIDSSGTRFSSLEAAINQGINNVSLAYQNDENGSEWGCVIYTIENVSGYVVGANQSSNKADEVTLVYDDVGTPIANIHTHPYHNDHIIYNDQELTSLKSPPLNNNWKIDSYVIDPCGCIYVLRHDSKSYMDYEVLVNNSK